MAPGKACAGSQPAPATLQPSFFLGAGPAAPSGTCFRVGTHGIVLREGVGGQPPRGCLYLSGGRASGGGPPPEALCTCPVAPSPHSLVPDDGLQLPDLVVHGQQLQPGGSGGRLGRCLGGAASAAAAAAAAVRAGAAVVAAGLSEAECAGGGGGGRGGGGGGAAAAAARRRRRPLLPSTRPLVLAGHCLHALSGRGGGRGAAPPRAPRRAVTSAPASTPHWPAAAPITARPPLRPAPSSVRLSGE